jgi:hypothetical protein
MKANAPSGQRRRASSGKQERAASATPSGSSDRLAPPWASTASVSAKASTAITASVAIARRCAEVAVGSVTSTLG